MKEDDKYYCLYRIYPDKIKFVQIVKRDNESSYAYQQRVSEFRTKLMKRKPWLKKGSVDA